MAETQSSDVTLTVAKLAALFSSLTAGLYTAMQIESAPVIDLFLSGAPLVAVILWLEKDVTRTGVGAVQDFDYFLLLAWPVVIPWYVFKTRGRDGWALLCGLMLLIMSAAVTRIAVPRLIYAVQYAVWYVQS